MENKFRAVRELDSPKYVYHGAPLRGCDGGSRCEKKDMYCTAEPTLPDETTNDSLVLNFHLMFRIEYWLPIESSLLLLSTFGYLLGVAKNIKSIVTGGPKLFWISIVQGLHLRCPAVAGREGMETQSSLWCIPHVICHRQDWVSICSLPRRQKEHWGSFRRFQLRPCQGRLAQPVGRNRLVAPVVLRKGTPA